MKNLICRWRGHNWGRFEVWQFPVLPVENWYNIFPPKENACRLRVFGRTCSRCRAEQRRFPTWQWWVDGRWQAWEQVWEKK